MRGTGAQPRGVLRLECADFVNDAAVLWYKHVLSLFIINVSIAPAMAFQLI